MTCNPQHIPEPLNFVHRQEDQAESRSREFLEDMSRRRSVRSISSEPVNVALVRNAIATANTAPSGANLQPWHFVIVSDPVIKRRIREGAEQEEQAFYKSRATEWLSALEPLGTDWHKPFLEDAPYLIVVFEVHKSESTPKPYYVKESVGIAVGLLIASLHLAGLATLTHTPSPMGFLNKILERPSHERAFVVLPVGKPAAGAEVPRLDKKDVEDVLTTIEAATRL